MNKTKIFMTAAALVLAIGGAFASSALVNDVYVKTTNPLEPCALIACQQTPTLFACDIAAPVDGKYYQAGCSVQVSAFRP